MQFVITAKQENHLNRSRRRGGRCAVDLAKDGGQKNVGAEKFFRRGWGRTADEHSSDADREDKQRIKQINAPKLEKATMRLVRMEP